MDALTADTQVRQVLIQAWLRYLAGLEALAEHEATAAGQPYHRCPPSRLAAAAVGAAEAGVWPPPRLAGPPRAAYVTDWA